MALNQLQKVIGIDGAAESIVELFALRLDEQGTEFSTQCQSVASGAWQFGPGGPLATGAGSLES